MEPVQEKSTEQLSEESSSSCWRKTVSMLASDSSMNDDSIGTCASESSEEFVFYGVYVPPDCESACKYDEYNVFTDKTDALRVIKLNKLARFRAFSSEDEAYNFSKNGGTVISTDSPSNNSDAALFKGPRSQELVKFRKFIESNDIQNVKNLIDENPRYLVGSGDTPTILQEGSRYNALHIAARSNAAAVASYILMIVSNVSFMKRLYGQDVHNPSERRDVLLDLYLNMPDKGSNETPLHFASKLGAVDVVRVLISYTMCDKTRKNKSGLTPIEVVCSRAPDHMQGNKLLIINALEDLYYVPVLRCDDNSVPPTIGEPVTSPLTSPVYPEQGALIVTPTREVRAVAGPMNEEEAKLFRKRWKTPSRLCDTLKYRPELSDPEKGLEVVGRKLAHESNVKWKEYWPFLNAFVDLTTTEGLIALENFLKDQFIIKRSGKIPESTGHVIKDSNRDHVADYFTSVVDQLAYRMQTLSLKSPTDPCSETLGSLSSLVNPQAGDTESVNIRDLDLSASLPSRDFGGGDYHNPQEIIRPLSPLPMTMGLVNTTTMEKSCQVFASRIGLALTKGLKSSVLDEIAKFQIFLSGCVNDSRFRTIDLTKIHYRLSALINEKVLSLTTDRHSIVSLLLNVNSFQVNFHEDKKLPLENLIQATLCICRCTVALLSYSSPIEEADYMSINQDIDSDILWSVAESCPCSMPVLKNTRARYTPRILFQDDDFNYKNNNSEEDGSEDESSDEFHTAPCSPNSSSFSSDDEDGDMVLSERGPDVFLSGEKPTKLDKAVLEAIENIPISMKTYPHIVMWKNGCLEHSKAEPRERWATPRPSNINRRAIERSYCSY